MASKEESELVNISVEKGNNKYDVEISKDLWNMLNSPECDPAVKSSILQSAYAAAAASPSSESNASTSTSRASNSSDETAPCSEKVHIWKENEERDLIQLRFEMEDQFKDIKNHDVLWGQITKKLNSHNVCVSVLQVKNKWKNLKKTYKKVVDENSLTGNKPTTWKFFEEFNNIFGNRASTRAGVTYDSSSKRKLVKSVNTDDTDSDTHCNYKPKKLRVEKNATPAAKAIEKLTKQGEEMIVQMKSQHDEKMERFDRLLSLLEKKN